MAAKTTISQRCQAVTDGTGVVRFEIATAVDFVAAGDLPQREIFVHRIVLPLDPKADAFMRIATIADLTALTCGRDQALALNKTVYLAGGFTLSYPDLPTANEAKKLVQSRIDRLVSDWRTYNTDFKNPSRVTFPLVPPGVIQARTNDFVDAKRAMWEADDAVAAAQVAFDEAGDAADRADTALTAATTARLECQAQVTALSSVNSAANAFRVGVSNALGSLRSTLGAGGLEKWLASVKTTLECVTVGAASGTDIPVPLSQPLGTGTPVVYKADGTLLTLGAPTGANDVYALDLTGQRLKVGGALAGQKLFVWYGQDAALTVLVASLKQARDAIDLAVANESTTGLSVMAGVIANATEACGKRQTELEAAVTAKATADGAVATTQTNLAVAQAEATAAKAAAAAAYAKVKEVCPSYIDADME